MSVYLMALIFAWISGGLLFVRGATVSVPNDNSEALLAGLRRGEVAAFVALVVFLVVWPVAFVGAHVAKWRA